ncbi:hypothetical protein AB0I84_49260 [Streptomyces spectabilis]|uniref:hypothetical protein n=1 Tax=Streptomyces spectabilis TaxID=68270 RepID=UPI0033F43A1A
MIDRARVTGAVQALVAAATGKPCGRGRLPLVAGKPAPLPYTVLYPHGGLVGGAPLADQAEDAQLVYQVTVVAERTDQAEWLTDRVRHSLLGRTPAGEWVHPLVAEGADVWARELLLDDGVSGQEGSEVVTGVQQYGLSVTST